MKNKNWMLVALMMAFTGNRGYGAVPPGGVASFSDTHSASPTVTFNVAGTWTLQDCVSDGAKTTCAQTTVTVNPAIVASAKLTVYDANVIAGNAFDTSIMLTTQTVNVAGLQFDVHVPPGLMFNTATAGPSALAAGKSVSANMVGTDLRVIVFGMNQTVMPSGQVVVINFQTSAALAPGPLTLSLSNVFASDPAGIGVTMWPSVSGTIMVTAATINLAPVVTISPAQTITLPAGAVVSSAVTDDGPASALTHSWSAI